MCMFGRGVGHLAERGRLLRRNAVDLRGGTMDDRAEAIKKHWI